MISLCNCFPSPSYFAFDHVLLQIPSPAHSKFLTLKEPVGAERVGWGVECTVRYSGLNDWVGIF